MGGPMDATSSCLALFDASAHSHTFAPPTIELLLVVHLLLLLNFLFAFIPSFVPFHFHTILHFNSNRAPRFHLLVRLPLCVYAFHANHIVIHHVIFRFMFSPILHLSFRPSFYPSFISPL
ncbi:hypothetical protein C8R44DRAFT_810847, partial [Mycena epipterygia]